MLKLSTILFILLTLLSNISQATCFSRLILPLMPEIYIGAIGGINGGYDLKCKRVRIERGSYLGVRIGKEFLSHIKLEEEFAWQENEVQNLKSRGIQLEHVKGNVNIWSLMTNGIFNFNFNDNLPAQPLIGLGIGYTHTEGNWSGHLPLVNKNFYSNHTYIKTSFHKGGLAWQLIAGLTFPVFCGIDIRIEYRFFKMNRDISNHKFGLSLTKLF